MSASFREVELHLQDELLGVKRAVFLDRGGHAPGDPCPSEPPPERHNYWCQYPDDECSCLASDGGV